jgi:hypothetical protein
VRVSAQYLRQQRQDDGSTAYVAGFKDRVDDAMHATRAAVEEGILPGGGGSLLTSLKAIETIPRPTRTRRPAWTFSQGVSGPPDRPNAGEGSLFPTILTIPTIFHVGHRHPAVHVRMRFPANASLFMYFS